MVYIPIIGIAKRLEEIYFPEDQSPIHISKKSISLKVLQQLRDEAHRFAIAFHRNKRSKDAIKSSLDNISGIGPQTKKILLQEFGSISRIKQSSEKVLIDLIGNSKTKILQNAIKKGNL